MPLVTNRREAGGPEEEAGLYDRDIVLWAEAQVRALRSRRLSDLDIEHLAEEIEDVSGRMRSELRSRTRTLVEHLLKLRHSRASGPRLGWLETVERTRLDIEDLLADAPSLRPTLPDVLDRVRGEAVQLAARSLDRAGETVPAVECKTTGADFDVDQVFGEWLPGAAE